MATRRVKDISYDEDELEDYEEGLEDEASGLSAEDQEQMRVGLIAVRDALGSESDFTTDKEIHDALWYYYYDIDKSVAYLRKQKHPDGGSSGQQTPKKQKQATKFDQAANKAVNTAGAMDHFARPLWSCASSVPADFFADVPFMSVPSHRLGTLTPPNRPCTPRGGLLGGSGTAGKPSKLAALAAARKQAAEQKRRAEAGGAENHEDGNGSSLQTLDRLGKRQKTGPEPERTDVAAARTGVGSLKIDDTTQSAASRDVESASAASPLGTVAKPPSKRTYPKQERHIAEQKSPKIEVELHELAASEEPSQPPELSEEDLQASPSDFATSLFSSTAASSGSHTQLLNDLFTFPTAAGSEKANDPFSGPSPDDVVTRAQQGKGSTSTTSKSPSVRDATNGLKKVKLGGSTPVSGATTPIPEKVKSKGIDVATEYGKGNKRRSATFVVIGHVDHGKSTLMGRLLYDTSYISSRDFSKLSASAAAAGKSSFNYAWLMDSTEEERARGITVDIAQTSFSVPATETTPATDFNILDAPGHKDFVPNMIAGASQADFAVLVVDASTGEFEKGLEGGGQTKEHALLVRGLGVQSVIVAVNKMDQTGWNESRFHEVKGQMSAFLTKIGYRKDDLKVVPCAGITGENVVFRPPPSTDSKSNKSKPSTPSDADRLAWYTGPTLLDSLSLFTPAEHNLRKSLRLTISDVFRSSITNPLSISGRLDQGTVQVGDTLFAMPANEPCSIRGIEVSGSSDSDGKEQGGSQSVDYAVAGQIATLHLTDIDPIHLRLGDVLCDKNDPVKNVSAFTAKVLAFSHVMPGVLDCHRGRLHCSATVTKLIEVVESGKGKCKPSEQIPDAKKKRPRIVKPGQAALVEVKLERPLPLEQWTRIVLRSEGTTVAAGKVESIIAW